MIYKLEFLKTYEEKSLNKNKIFSTVYFLILEIKK